MATPANTTRRKSILVTEAHGKFMMIYSHQSSSVIYIIYKYHYSVWSTIIIYIYIIYIIGDLPCYNWVTTCYNYKNTIHSYHEEVVTTPSSCFSVKSVARPWTSSTKTNLVTSERMRWRPYWRPWVPWRPWATHGNAGPDMPTGGFWF